MSDAAKKEVRKDLKKDQLVKPMVSIQIIHFYCGNCNEELDEVKFCPSCKAPMRVINVVEKFGEEAEKYLEALKGGNGAKFTTDAGLEKISTMGVGESIVGEDDEPEVLENLGAAKGEDDEWADLAGMAGEGGIFGEGDESEDQKSAKPKAMDLEDLVKELDKDDEGEKFSDDEMEEFKGFSDL